MTKKLLFAASFILILAADSGFAKDWNGFFPLYSTKTEVLNRFGKADLDIGPVWYIYRFDEYRVAFEYSLEICDGGYYVPEGRVLSITILPNTMPKWVELSIPNRQTLKKSGPDVNAFLEYSDEKEGISYYVQDGLLNTINYGPSAADEYLRCPK